MKKEDDGYRGRKCAGICDRIDYFVDTTLSFRHFYRKVKNYQFETLMRYFKLTRTHDPLYEAKDLRDVVNRAINVEIQPGKYFY